MSLTTYSPRLLLVGGTAAVQRRSHEPLGCWAAGRLRRCIYGGHARTDEVNI